MNKTRKLRGGDVLTQIERARLASIKSNTISGKVRDMLDYLKALTQSGKKEFDSEQGAEALGRNAGAMIKLYVAAGVFVAFLFISLILVLVKIERNLRTTKLEVLTQE